MDQPCKVANPAISSGQLKRKSYIFPCPPFAPENYLVSRDRFGRPVPRQPAHSPHSKAESGAYSRDSSRFARRRPFIYAINRNRVGPEFIRS